ncbi:hypothetical protein SAMN04488524_1787 [Pedobacter africanus]|uniref:Uncharacterized protein n=1 Tax=Pedobacter africanus TaxID=151894 RepID=A0A1W2B049_9SPHI|nr:hypothetical protein SAMN04488524_1787 [Pedobacter africanus]
MAWDKFRFYIHNVTCFPFFTLYPLDFLIFKKDLLALILVLYTINSRPKNKSDKLLPANTD